MAESGQLEICSTPYHLEKFYFYETHSNFYMIGRDESKMNWRVLKIGRSEPSELSIFEDPTTYSFQECKSLLEGIQEGNKLNEGCKFITTCFGIVGFIKFLIKGAYHIILITQRKKIGQICGHPVYAISKYKMIRISHSAEGDGSKENRRKKLFLSVDITRDFFFSYSYPLMHSLQKNLCKEEKGGPHNGTMFVWNEYLTHHIVRQLDNTLWTVALIHGFFKQVQLSSCGKPFSLTVIARRSRRFAGTRYNKRGVNDSGYAANTVEIEQIVSEDTSDGGLYKMTSAVQIRGSIPISWSQKDPKLGTFRPPINVSDGNWISSYEGTQLHFINLHRRYGHPVIILNLIKKHGHESPLSHEFRRAVDCINLVLDEDDKLKFWHLDLHTAYEMKRAGALMDLKHTAASALRQIKFFSCQVPQSTHFRVSANFSEFRSSADCTYSYEADSWDEDNCYQLQNGVLRVNCKDSLDRTNVAQYVYGLVALGHQLQTLAINETPNLDLNDSLSYGLMSIYEAMGNALAHQYAGSAAHNKIFAECRGQCNLATKFLEFIKKVQRFLSNYLTDGKKQQAIDINLESDACECLNRFLGILPPEADELPRRISNIQQRRLQRCASDTEVLHKMVISDWDHLLVDAPGSGTPRWCSPFLDLDPGSPYIGGPFFGATRNYFTDTEETGPSVWSESEYEQEALISEDEG